MGIIAWIVFGLLAGWVAKMLVPGRDPQGCIITMVIGVLGAVIGGFIGSWLGFGAVTGFNLKSFLIAVVGSVLLLALYHLIRGRR
ncbi:MAG TPA: GlsB/YeaQ/YmgE family stress response membrane protein [Thermoanaerobaculia bacterium]|nr:GlsB/YeaQ/YmgE family stress response membrane protein [Thermoanaerobaculia bacterium]HXT52560.1 GlsB/YeaQ/YmgE family stress response membrane protein [Thermoanaerobaculia bacterium]